MNTNEITDTVHRPLLAPVRKVAAIVALCVLVATATATWLTPAPAAADKATRAAPTAPAAAADEEPADPKPAKPAKKSKAKQALSGKLNLNTATPEQLMMLPGVGPSKAERVVAWRKKNGNFKRVADLRKVKGFGYKTVKKLEGWLDVKGASTLEAK
jgi:competence protein ComEA